MSKTMIRKCTTSLLVAFLATTLLVLVYATPIPIPNPIIIDSPVVADYESDNNYNSDNSDWLYQPTDIDYGSSSSDYVYTS
ncbi:hypothetical protein F5H01DRAFT_365716 [Linnemannia elongata]|nr:hypothetical protein F5H01DRAFT_365716 [Linnemannia elongata]